MAKYQPREEDVAETFIIYADHSGSLPVGSLGTCLRALGWNPSEVEVQVRRSTASAGASARDRERERQEEKGTLTGLKGKERERDKEEEEEEEEERDCKSHRKRKRERRKREERETCLPSSFPSSDRYRASSRVRMHVCTYARWD